MWWRASPISCSPGTCCWCHTTLIHRPIIDPAEPYERVVVWLGREWLERRGDPGEPLETCFDSWPGSGGSTCCASTGSGGWTICSAIQRLEEATAFPGASAPPGMADTLCQQLLIAVDRDILRSRTAQEETGQLPGGPQDRGDAPVHRRPIWEEELTVDVPGQAVFTSAGTI